MGARGELYRTKGGAMVGVYIVLAIIFVVLLWALMRIRRRSA